MFHNATRMILLPALLGLIVLSGCDNKGATAQPEPSVKPEHQKMMIETMVLEPVDLAEKFTLPGVVEAWEDLQLAAELAGPVSWVGVDEGAALKAGQAILRIDPQTVKANLQRDQTAFELQQQEQERYQKLLSDQLVSQQEFDRVKNGLEVARANLRQSELALDKSTCRTPVNGVLDRLLVDRGEYVGIGDPLARVVQIDKLKVLVDLPEKDVSFVRPGQKVRVVAASMKNADEVSYSGEVLHIGYQADQASRTYRVKLVIDNPNGDLRPGMILRVEFKRRNHVGVLAIPLYSLIDQEGKKFVFVEKNGKAEKREVTPGAVVGHQILVSDGLAVGEKLVVKGHQLLTDGALVSVKEQ